MLSDGTERNTWYWEANWPNNHGEGVKECFSVKEYGEAVARQMAIRARERGMKGVTGLFWSSERGAVEANDQTRTLIDNATSPARDVA